MSFLILALVVLAQHFTHFSLKPLLSPGGYIGLFLPSGRIGRLGSDIAYGIWLALPLLLATLLHIQLAHYFFGVILLVVLLMITVYCALGYSECVHALNKLGYEKVQSPLRSLVAEVNADATHAEKHTFAVGVILRCVMMPIFWTFLLSGYGALIVLLVYSFHRTNPDNTSCQRTIALLEWVPARLLVLSYALDFRNKKLWGACKQICNLKNSDELIHDFVVPEILNKTSLRRNKPQSILLRQVTSWFAAMALITLFTIIF